jgi:hypothetical protein
MIRLGMPEGYDGTVCLIELSHISAISLALHVRHFSCIKFTLPHLKADLVHQSSLKPNSLSIYVLFSSIPLQTIINMSFHYSAENIRVDDGHILRARLQRADGEWNDSEIDLNNHIGNDNGTHAAVLCSNARLLIHNDRQLLLGWRGLRSFGRKRPLLDRGRWLGPRSPRHTLRWRGQWPGARPQLERARQQQRRQL